MIKYFGFLMLMTFLALMVGRGVIMKRHGISLLVIGQKDKRALPPFLMGYVLFIYIISSNAFPLPMPSFAARFFWNAPWLQHLGGAISFLANLSFLACIISFGNSFRVGIDELNPGNLVTAGMYSISRNPMYTSFDALFIGIFLLYPNLGTLFVLALGLMSFHAQIIKEEAFCRKRYGEEYERYCKKVRRYL
jgi:protein-S-isoprenylcysteine O-methyltransferase Ste14